MTSYQILAVFVACLLVSSCIVGVLVFFGVPVLITFVSVYLAAIWFMTSLQRRARDCAELHHELHQELNH